MLAALLSASVLVVVAGRVGAASVTLPDMQIKVPTNLISAGVDSGTGHRMLRFTHITWDAGAGPFEIDPAYNAATGTASFVQSIYKSPSPGVWTFDHTVPVATTGVFDPPSDYQFPLTSFTLNIRNADGSPGAVVARSPKKDYCITADAFVGGVPNTPDQTFIPPGNCTDPTKPLGWSVGWGDQYDQTDAGQPIDLTGIADGIYVLHATVDPEHVLTESNPSNNVTDTTLKISGTTVTVISQTQPGTHPPAVKITKPASGAGVSGTVALRASASAAAPNTITSVQFLLDGQPLGAPRRSAPYAMNWTVGTTALGSHTITARATDSQGNIGTSPAVRITVVSSNPNGLNVDHTLSSTGLGTMTTPKLSTRATNETLAAFVSSDGPSSGGQTATVHGAGLAWSLVKRANRRPGDAEIWIAHAVSRLTNVRITATLRDRYSGQLTVVAFIHSAGVGPSAAAAAATGAPTIKLLTHAAGSYSYAVGHDWTSATPRRLGVGQSLVAQWSNTSVGDDYWVQATTTRSSAVRRAVTLNDTAPTTDQWDLAAVEITPTSPPRHTAAPTVAVMNPTANQTLSGIVPAAANTTGSVAVASVQFFLDGKALGSPITKPPYATRWNTTTSASGTHTLFVQAKDRNGNIGTSRTVTVSVRNPPPPMTCFVLQAQVAVHTNGTATTAAFHTATTGETLLAFVASDGPNGAGQQAVTVTGAGLAWTRVKQSNAQTGDTEIWIATAKTVLASATVTSTPRHGGYDQDLTVIAMEGTAGIGATAAASAPTGTPHLDLATTKAASLVFAVGSDANGAIGRTLPTNWALLDQWIDSKPGDTYWTQYTNQTVGPAGTIIDIHDTAPAHDAWNLAAIELTGDS